MSIALAMIVRNEAENLVRCLDAALPIIDAVVLIDTGSEDGTQEIAREWCRENDITLHLRAETWENFKVNRTSLMRYARDKADWLLLLDADLVVHAPDPLPDLDSTDSWHGRIAFAHFDYTLPLFVRASKPWFYEGVAHSYLACEETFTENELPGLWVEDHSHTTVAKLESDLLALSAEHSRNPLDARTVFYLAQTYYDLDRYSEAIHFYRMRAEMGGWDEEVYFARYRLGVLLSEHVSFAQGAKELLRAWEERPGRNEALRALAGCATSVANKSQKSDDILFVEVPSYDTYEVRRNVTPPRLARKKTQPVVASIASIPDRQESLGRTIASLLPQVDLIRVYLNNYKTTPEFLNDPKIEVVRGDRGDGGKFFWVNQGPDGYRITCDDDIEYPPDYVDTLIAAIEEYDRRAIVGFHGRVFSSDGEFVRGYWCLDDVAEDAYVNLLGTGVLGYHTSTLPQDGGLPERNMADQWLSGKAQEAGIPCVVRAHREGWLKHTEHEVTMWDESQKKTGSPLDMSAEREAFMQSMEWQLHTVVA